MLHRIDKERRLYVLSHDHGFTCLGFDVARRLAEGVAAWLGETTPDSTIWGSEEGYSAYERLMESGGEYHQRTKKRCDIDLEPQLRGLEAKRVEVSQGGQRRRFWVGKSTGWMPCHLEIARRNSMGGPAAFGPYESVRVIRA